MAFMSVSPNEFIIYFIVGARRFGGERGMHIDFIRVSSLVNIPFTGEWNMCHSDEIFTASCWELMRCT
jgi:hypothetical protein